MTWIDDLQREVRRRETTQPNGSEGRGERDTGDTADAARLVRSLLEELNRELLAGRGSVWEAQTRWGVGLWEIWWGTTRTEGQHIVVTLLRDSRGTPYVKVQRKRVAVQDPSLERRLQMALQTAFLQPSMYQRP